MPSYSGGKFLTGKKIYDAIKKDLHNQEVKDYIDPFCGGLNVIKHFVDDYDCYASDNNEDLIYLWNCVKNGELTEMPVVSKERYYELKKDKTLSLERCYAVFYCTMFNIYEGSYTCSVLDDGKRQWYFHKGRYNNIKKEEPMIKKMNFKNCSYDEIDVSDGGHLIYLDPPYKDTNKVYKSKDFCHNKFWAKVLQWKNQGNYVYVSELTCPLDNEIIYTKNKVVHMGVSNSKCKKMVDNLYKIL